MTVIPEPIERFDVLVLRQCDPSLAAPEAHDLAILVWSSLHGFAVLRSARPQLDWPSAEDYVRRSMAAHVPAAGR